MCEVVSTPPHLPALQDLKHPHRQMMVSVAACPKKDTVVTASQEEVRGWYWPTSGKAAPELLWTVHKSGILSIDTSPEPVSYRGIWAYLDSTVILVMADRKRHLILCKLDLDRRAGCLGPSIVAQVDTKCSASDSFSLSRGADEGVVLWSESAGWMCWDTESSAGLIKYSAIEPSTHAKDACVVLAPGQ